MSSESRARDRLWGQVDAHTVTVRTLAEYLEGEGIKSYARPLRAVCENLEEAVYEFEEAGDGGGPGIAAGRLRKIRMSLTDASENLEHEDVELAREYVEEALERLEEAEAATLPGSHREYDAGEFRDDGLFYGHVRCWCCGAVEKLDGVDEAPRLGPDEKSRRVSFRGFEGTYLDAYCSMCSTRLVAMDDGELSPVFGDRW